MTLYNPIWVSKKFPNSPKQQRDYLMQQFGYLLDREDNEMWQLCKPKKFNVLLFIILLSSFGIPGFLYLIYYAFLSDKFIIISKHQNQST